MGQTLMLLIMGIELLEAFMSTNKNYDFVVDSIINLYEEF